MLIIAVVAVGKRERSHVFYNPPARENEIGVNALSFSELDVLLFIRGRLVYFQKEKMKRVVATDIDSRNKSSSQS